MRKMIQLALVVLVAIGAWCCSDQQPVSSGPHDVQFTVRAVTSSTQGRVAAVSLPSGAELLLSIRTAGGESVLTHERVELLKLGDGYVSKAISLVPGTYSVVDFMLVLGDSVLYATPQAGSPLAGIVANPLPYSFTVSADALLTLQAEVVATGSNPPSAFGYAEFDIRLISGENILIAAFVSDGPGGNRLTDGEAFVMDGTDTVEHIVLKAGTSALPFNEDPTTTYTLVVLKHGYKRYARNFIYEDLQEELQGKPLQVTLEPAFTYVLRGVPYTRVNVSTGPIIIGPEGKLYTDFGDGVGGGYWNIGGVHDNAFDHVYERSGDYFVSVTGDLDLLTEIGIRTNLDAIDVSRLPKLKGLLMQETGVLRILDLTKNHQLEYLYIQYSPTLQVVSFSRTGRIREVDIRGTGFTSATVSALIDDVYAAATFNSTGDGGFRYEGVATPSAEALEKLRVLKNTYRWTVIPEP